MALVIRLQQLIEEGERLAPEGGAFSGYNSIGQTIVGALKGALALAPREQVVNLGNGGRAGT